MPLIDFQDVSVDFPIYNADGRSLKKTLMQVATGGQLRAGQSRGVVVRALERLTLTFQSGDRVGLLGHNGAGKSTLLRVLGGVYQPTSGVARIEGTIGSLINVSLGVDKEATGRENIMLRGLLLGLSHSEINNRMDEIVEFSELGNFLDMPLRAYSTGMHLRLAFAISTVIRPDILLMDEWLSVGDAGFREKAEKRISELVESTRILVIASHSKNLIMKTCNRVIWLEHGKIHMDGPVDDVCNAYFANPKKPGPKA